MNGFHYWELLGGIGLFLFAMVQLELALKALAGESLAVFLKQQAERRVNAVLGGLVATAILQSSSIVGLMVLAFVGAGLLSLPAALAVVFGSNVGTTLTGWIVALLGFKLGLEDLALPLIAAGAAAFVFGRSKWTDIGQVILGLGLLLLSLGFMKNSVASLESMLDLAQLASLAPWQYLLFGAAVTVVIQSSSATMMLTLTALYSGILTLPNAAVIAIGANLGSTATVMLGAIKGSIPKRQVAAGHFLFNAVTAALAFAFVMPLLAAIAAVGVVDPLYVLVAFHTLFNMLGLMLFLPFTQPFAALLERIFGTEAAYEARYLADVAPGISSAGLAAVEQESARTIARTVRLLMAAFMPPLPRPPGRFPVPYEQPVQVSDSQRFQEIYTNTKKLEGEIVDFALQLQRQELTPEETERLSQLLGAVRHAMHSAKAVKDIRHNLAELRLADADRGGRFHARFREWMQNYMQQVFQLREEETSPLLYEDMATLLQWSYRQHEQLHAALYAEVRANRSSAVRVSTLLNMNREFLNACLSLSYALADFHLQPAEALALERWPGAAGPAG